MAGTMKTATKPMGATNNGTGKPMGATHTTGGTDAGSKTATTGKTTGAGGAQMNGGSKSATMTGSTKARMGGSSTTAQGNNDNSELSRFMNNGGGPEPHQGSNPGAQSDPGPKEVGYYDRAHDHMGGDDGIQNTSERPSPMRMGGVEGSQPNPGQRGGQNTGTSGAQTTSYSSPEEYGAGSIPGVTGTRGGNAEDRMKSTQTHEYQSRAASRLATSNGGSSATGRRMGDSAENFESTPAAKAEHAAETAADEAKGFMDTAKNKVEGFFDTDFDGDGNVGEQRDPIAFDTHDKKSDLSRDGLTDDMNGSQSSPASTLSGSRGASTASGAMGGTPSTSPYDERGAMRTGSSSRTDAQQRKRELVNV